MRGGGEEGYAGDGDGDKDFHGQDPPTFAFEQVDERAPQRLDGPRQVEPAGVEGDFCVGKPEPFIHHGGDGHVRHVG